MKHLFLSALIIVLSGILSACVTSPKPGSPEAAIKIAQEVKEEKEDTGEGEEEESAVIMKNSACKREFVPAPKLHVNV